MRNGKNNFTHSGFQHEIEGRNIDDNKVLLDKEIFKIYLHYMPTNLLTMLLYFSLGKWKLLLFLGPGKS